MQRSHSKQPEFRLVRYFSQWPLGDDFEIVGEHLTHEQAEKLLAEKNTASKADDLVIEEMEENFRED